MEWNLTRPEESSSVQTDEMIEEQVKRNVMFVGEERILSGPSILAYPAAMSKWLRHLRRATT